jgi:hypothetical protein
MFLEIICILLIILYFIFYFQRQRHKKKEGFNNIIKKDLVIHHNYDEIYDDFYSFMYDELFYNENYYNKLSLIILLYLNNVYNNHLCIGIKHGGHINELLRNNMDTLSISVSKNIINVCKHKYNNNNYQYVKSYTLNPYIFNENQFTHISIIDNEIYYQPELYSLFNNCDKWIIHKGYLFIQLYNSVKDMKEGVLKINIENNAQIVYNYASNLKTTSKNNQYYLIETLKNKNKKIKKHHSLFYYDTRFIVNILKELNFIFVKNHEINDLEKLWVFQKH